MPVGVLSGVDCFQVGVPHLRVAKVPDERGVLEPHLLEVLDRETGIIWVGEAGHRVDDDPLRDGEPVERGTVGAVDGIVRGAETEVCGLPPGGAGDTRRHADQRGGFGCETEDVVGQLDAGGSVGLAWQRPQRDRCALAVAERSVDGFLRP